MGEYNTALGMGHTVRAGDKDWVLSDLTGKIKGAFESWLEKNVLKTITDMKGELSPDDYRATIAEHARAKSLLKYSWGNEYCREALTSDEGYAHLFRLLLSKNHEEVKGWTSQQLEELFASNKEGFKETMRYVLSNPKDGTPVKTPAQETE